MGCSMSDDFEFQDVPSKMMEAELLLLQEMNRMSVYRVNDRKQYCSAIEGFIEDCETFIRNKAMKKMKELNLVYCDYDNITPEKFRNYCLLKVYTYELLERRGKIFKKRDTKTFE